MTTETRRCREQDEGVLRTKETKEMVCGNCGCRMVAKSLSDALVCVDCGQPADVRALQDGARRSWTAAVALLGFAGFSALVLAFAVMLDLRQEQLSPTQALTGRLE